MTKIVYNDCYGGFSLSKVALARYAEIKGWKFVDEPEGTFLLMPSGEEMYNYEIGDNRTDPVLVQVVEELGVEANDNYSHLMIAELPAGSLYRIVEYDGLEYIETPETINWDIA